MPVKQQRESEAARVLRIKTNTLRRTCKDVEYARREVDTERARLQTLRAQASDRVSQQEQVLREAEMMVPHAHNRCAVALRDVREQLDKHDGDSDAELRASAQTVIADAQALLAQDMDKSTAVGSAAAATGRFPNYLADVELSKRLLRDYRDAATGAAVYVDMAREVAARRRVVYTIALDDIAGVGQLHLAQRIQMNVLGYMDELYKVVDELVAQQQDDDEEAHVDGAYDVIDQLAGEARAAGQPLPAELTRRYELVLLPLRATAQSPLPLRELRGSVIGTLTVLRGICIAATVVRPRLTMLVSVCEVCAEMTLQQVTGDRLAPLQVCQSQRCKLNNTVGRLLPQYKASKFVKHQELRVQELPQDVPRGAVPRTVRVLCAGEQTRIAAPGQVVRLIGTYCPDPSTGQGHEAFRASTMVKTLYRALHVELEKQTYESAADELRAQVAEARAYPDRDAVIEKLTRSIAPEIWGNEDVKKVLLCQLVGGSALARGIRIRSDLNVLLMGDPGVAKSQLLKWIAATAPRSIFTTGKGSSGVGLTAAVTRDQHTGEVVLEGGALVLADKGICCIDEFDKMDDVDRTALHEVMEQQMVSIAKAGIITSLNARTSILAASNPKYGRWRRAAPPSENVNLPPALLSRFDVLWLLLDDSNRERDAELSMHVTHVHLHGAAPGTRTDHGVSGSSLEYFGREFVRAYVGEARRLHPYIDPAAAKTISDIYCQMRAQSAHANSVVTARTLLSLIRLSQACARLRFAARVLEVDVREAGRLLDCSKASLHNTPANDTRRSLTTSDAAIFALVKELARGRAAVDLADVRPALMMKGISEANLQRCIQTYTDVGVWSVQGSYIEFADD